MIIYGPTNACPNGESGGQNVDNGANIGVMQINWPSHLDKLEKVTGSRDWTLLRDPDINIAVGYEVFVSNGRTFGAWSCHP